jgi:hypothetical protein
MPYSIILQIATKYGLIGCVGFFILLIVVDRTGIFKAVRDEEGNFKKKFNATAWIGMTLMFGFLITVAWSSLIGLDKVVVLPSFVEYWLTAFITFFIIHLSDLIVIDIMLIVWWHPKFLNLPDTDYYTKSKPHIQGFFRGIPFGLVMTLLVSVIYFYL